jgi:hydrogenase nickel incorporation protein HypA/HybF
MHELSVCQALLAQVDDIARTRGADSIERIEIELGPLCGVEPVLLEQAFVVARQGRASNAVLGVTATEVIVACEGCGARTQASPNRLLCGVCGSYRTRLVSGDELHLRRVVLHVPARPSSAASAVRLAPASAAGAVR